MGCLDEHVCFKLTAMCAPALRIFLSEGVSVCVMNLCMCVRDVGPSVPWSVCDQVGK